MIKKKDSNGMTTNQLILNKIYNGKYLNVWKITKNGYKRNT